MFVIILRNVFLLLYTYVLKKPTGNAKNLFHIRAIGSDVYFALLILDTFDCLVIWLSCGSPKFITFFFLLDDACARNIHSR